MKYSFDSVSKILKNNVGWILLIAVVGYIYYSYFMGKSKSGSEYMSKNNNPAYGNNNKRNQPPTVQPSQGLGQNEVYASFDL